MSNSSELSMKARQQPSSRRLPFVLQSSLITNLPQQLVRFLQGNAASVTALLTVTIIALYYRSVWLPLLKKDVIQAKTLSLLSKLRPDDGENNGPAMLRALAMYAAGMTVWEALGLSTIPVETAAAMVFGWKAWWPSALGKLLGASLAFALGKTILSGPAQRRLLQPTSGGTNVWSQLIAPPSSSATGSGVDHATLSPAVTPAHPPLVTALCLKFSCFPEVIKNVGSGLVSSIHPWHFVAATMFHGWSFTTLWTAVGVHAASNMKQTVPFPAAATVAATTTSSSSAAAAMATVSTPLALRLMMVLTLLIGVVGSPVLMAWWIRDLQRHASETVEASALLLSPTNCTDGETSN